MVAAMELNLSPSQRNKPILDDSTGVVRLVREQAPEDCNFLKVASFSLFQDALSNSTSVDCISSKEFNAGGHTWVLCVYPNGNKHEDGDGHLSLSVSLVDNDLDSGTRVNAGLRFFIYDQIRDNYLAFLDIRDKCFHGLKTTWGIPKVMPLKSFTDASNGFLVKDCCVFGVEVLVKSNYGKINAPTMSLMKPEFDKTYTWKIENFSGLKNQLYSPIFHFGDWSWKLCLYPKGDMKWKGKHLSRRGQYLSLYLHLDNANELTHGRKLYVKQSLCIKYQGIGEDCRCIKQRLCILNHSGIGKDHKRTVCKLFHSKSSSWGWPAFQSLSEVFKTSKGFLVNDTLIVEAKVEEMLLLKDMDPTFPK